MPSEATLRSLSQLREGPCISIYVPTHRRGAEIREDPIRLRHLLAEARQRADEHGVDAATVEALLDPTEDILRSKKFWQHQREGLALLASTEGIGVHRVDVPVDAVVHVGSRFCVRPLVRAVRRGVACYALALSRNRVRLLRCTTTAVDAIESPALPRSLEEALSSDRRRPTLQVHSGGGRQPVFHGQGSGEPGDEDLERFVREIDGGVCRMVPAGAPLVLAGVDRIRSVYARHSHYRFLAGEGIGGSPDARSDSELRERAMAIAAAELDRPRREALRRLEDAPPALVARGLEEVIPAARAGRVEWLIACTETPIWGVARPGESGVDVHPDRQPGDDDLIDLAIAESLATGAHVASVPADNPSVTETAVALLRF